MALEGFEWRGDMTPLSVKGSFCHCEENRFGGRGTTAVTQGGTMVAWVRRQWWNGDAL